MVHSGCWVTTEVFWAPERFAPGLKTEFHSPSVGTIKHRLTFHEYLPLQSTFRSEFFPACFADPSSASAQPPERSLLPTNSVPTVAQGASRSFRCPSSRHQLRASTCRAEIPIPHYVSSMAFHPPSTICSVLNLASLFHPATVFRVQPSGVQPLVQSCTESSSANALMPFTTPPDSRNRRTLPTNPACDRSHTGRADFVFKALFPAPGMTATTRW